MAEETERTYSTVEVTQALGIPRVTFDAWLLRRYLPFPPGPGTGRQRRFTLLDAVRIAYLAKLNRLGIAVSVAAASCRIIPSSFRSPDGRRLALILASTADDLEEQLNPRAPTVSAIAFESWETVGDFVRLRLPTEAAEAVVVVDITALADRVERALANFGG